jgi:hypothetical protein
MNKYLAWLPVLIIAGGSLYMPVKQVHEEKYVNKNISFAVYKNDSYASEVYDNTSAQVHIIIEKAGKNRSTVICDTTLTSKMLKDYPSIKKAQYQKIIIPAINIGQEHLEIKYILTYNSKGSELQMQDKTVVSNDGTTQVDISI